MNTELMLAVSIAGEMVSIFRNRGFLTAGITVSKSRTHGTPTPDYSPFSTEGAKSKESEWKLVILKARCII